VEVITSTVTQALRVATNQQKISRVFWQQLFCTFKTITIVNGGLGYVR